MALLDRQIVYVTGKGGVGKTTIAAALARLAARRGRRVLLCEADAHSSLGRLFPKVKIGFSPAEAESRLWVANVTGPQAMRAFVHRNVPAPRLADLVMENKVAGIFFESAPSVMEAVVLDQIGTLASSKSPGWDYIVVDLPASGHALTLLNVPRNMSRMIAVGGLAQRMKDLADLLAHPDRTELLLVALPEEMPVRETIELFRRAKEHVATPLRTVVVNGVRDLPVEAGDDARLDALRAWADGASAEVVARVADGARLVRYWRERDRANVERLRSSISARITTIPFLFRKRDESELLDRVSEGLESVA